MVICVCLCHLCMHFTCRSFSNKDDFLDRSNVRRLDVGGNNLKDAADAIAQVRLCILDDRLRLWGLEGKALAQLMSS